MPPRELPSLDLALALDLAQHLADARGVELVPPTSLARRAVVYGIGAWHALSGRGWDVAAAEERVSVTLPPAGPLLDLVRAIPYAGPVMADAVRDARKTTVFLSPAAVRDPLELLDSICHELGHADQLAAVARAGGDLGMALWCVAYGVAPELVGGAESACYGQDVAVRVLLGGHDPAAAERDAVASLGSYGLDPPAERLARAILALDARTLARGGVPGGPVVDLIREMRRRGLGQSLPALPGDP